MKLLLETKMFFEIFKAVQKLRRTYRTVEDIDLFAGMFLENPGFNNGLVRRVFIGSSKNHVVLKLEP